MVDEDLLLAKGVRDAALATEGVHSMGSGRYVEAATYGAGEKVTGVVVEPDTIRVHVIAQYPLLEPIPALGERIRDKVALRAGGRAALVVFDDLALEEA